MIAKFVLKELELRHQQHWLGAVNCHEGQGQGEVLLQLQEMGLTLNQRLRQRLSKTKDLCELLTLFQLKSIRLDSHMGLLGWLKHKYPLVIRHDIPQPEEMLDLQCDGKRFASLLIQDHERHTPIGRHAGAFEFLLHDLEHAHKFFGDPFLFQGQMHFFKFIRSSRHAFDLFEADPIFVKDYHYLISDMNSHPVHLFKYLKAIVLSAALRKTSRPDQMLKEFWLKTLCNWPEGVLTSALNINEPILETQKDRINIANFFIST